MTFEPPARVPGGHQPMGYGKMTKVEMKAKKYELAQIEANGKYVQFNEYLRANIRRYNDLRAECKRLDDVVKQNRRRLDAVKRRSNVRKGAIDKHTMELSKATSLLEYNRFELRILDDRFEDMKGQQELANLWLESVKRELQNAENEAGMPYRSLRTVNGLAVAA